VIGAGSQARQVFANVDAGELRGDGAEFAADLRRGVRLHVEGIEMTGAAGEEDDDDRFRAMGRRRGLGARSEDRRQPQAEQTAVTCLQHLAAGQAHTVAMAEM